MKRIVIQIFIFAVTFPFAGVSAFAELVYKVEVLQSLGGKIPFGGLTASANGINNAGQVVGISFIPNNSDVRGTLWGNPANPTDLGGPRSEFKSINNGGTVSGNIYNNSIPTAGFWRERVFYPLYSNGKDSLVFGLNDSDHAVGRISDNDAGRSFAVMWVDGLPIDLGWGSSSFALDINNSNNIIENSIYGGDIGLLWSNGQTIDLGSLGGEITIPQAINDYDHVVGISSLQDRSHNRAFIWSNGVMSELVGLDTNTLESSAATDINASDEIVGSAILKNGTQKAILWKDDKAIDLNRYLTPDQIDAGWSLDRATGINDRGWIIANGYNNKTFETGAYLLTPTAVVSEPATLSLVFLAVFLLLIGTRHRHNRIRFLRC